jgi:hypothetical protein
VRRLTEGEGRVVELALVGDDLRVGAGRSDEVVVTDEYADPCPRHVAEVEQRQAPVRKIVGRRGWYRREGCP